MKLYNIGFDAMWEIDIFGGVRRSVEQAKANTEAAVWQMHDGEVSLTAEVATDYLELRVLQSRLIILADEEKRERDTLSLVFRARGGRVRHATRRDPADFTSGKHRCTNSTVTGSDACDRTCHRDPARHASTTHAGDRA